MTNPLVRFVRYVNKSFFLDQLFRSVRDGRRGAVHSLRNLLWAMIGAIVSRFESFNQIEEAIRCGHFDFLGGNRRPSADTFARAFAQVDPMELVRINDAIVAKCRKNKSLQTVRVEGFKVAAIDGTGIFSTVSPRLGKNSHFRRNAHGEETDDYRYYENALAISYVGGSGPLLLLSLVRIPPGQGETTVAQAELKRLFAVHCRYADVFTLDANFAKAPVLNRIVDERKLFVVRVKQHNYDIIKDAAGLFDGTAPHETHRNVKVRDDSAYVYDLEIWDEEDFRSWEQVRSPLRCLRVRETRKKVNAAGEVVKSETVTTHFVTNAPKATMPALTAWKIAHVRWDIENTAIRFLKHHFQLEHAYSYDPQVIEVLYALFMIAFNLFMLFIHRNLRCRWRTMKGVIRQLYAGLVRLTESPLPEPLQSVGAT